MGRKKKKSTKPWCWYCNREFEDEKILLQHQKAKHFKCHICYKKLFTGPGLQIHCMQVHKENIEKVPNSIKGRDNITLEICGMENIPEQDLIEHEKQKMLQSCSKDETIDSDSEESDSNLTPKVSLKNNVNTQNNSAFPPLPPQPPPPPPANISIGNLNRCIPANISHSTLTQTSNSLLTANPMIMPYPPIMTHMISQINPILMNIPQLQTSTSSIPTQNINSTTSLINHSTFSSPISQFTKVDPHLISAPNLSEAILPIHLMQQKTLLNQEKNQDIHVNSTQTNLTSFNEKQTIKPGNFLNSDNKLALSNNHRWADSLKIESLPFGIKIVHPDDDISLEEYRAYHHKYKYIAAQYSSPAIPIIENQHYNSNNSNSNRTKDQQQILYKSNH